MQSANRKVSIIIPAFNAENYIGDAVHSALLQVGVEVDVVVVDDGSTDGTLTVLRSFGREVKVVAQANRGQAAARNVGVQYAEGDWIGFLDADDRFHPMKLQEQLALIEKQQGLFCTCDAEVIDARGKRIGAMAGVEERTLPQFLRGNFVCTSTVLLSRRLFNEMGGFDESLKNTEDGDLWFRILFSGVRMFHVEAVLACYRVHGANSSRSLVRQQRNRQAAHDKQFALIKTAGRVLEFGGADALAHAYAKQWSFGTARTVYRTEPARRNVRRALAEKLLGALDTAPVYWVLSGLYMIKCQLGRLVVRRPAL